MTLLNMPPYSLSRDQKLPLFLENLNRLTAFHTEHCLPYRHLIQRLLWEQPPYRELSAIPYLPVSLFKLHDLISIPKGDIYKTLLSSGTTTSIPSRIYLDRKTAHEQTVALASIMTSFIGKERLPLLLLESESVIKDPKVLSARGAALLGMLNFGRDPFYLFDQNMQVKEREYAAWFARHQKETILIFGLTFMIWQYLIEQPLLKTFDLSNSILFHTGGWKKLQERAVSPEVFNQTIQAERSIARCHNFYGFAEQVGSVYVECEAGVLHVPNFAEVIVRDPMTWKAAPFGQKGVLQMLSILPESYPGHSLLTEDLGVIRGVDTCTCGRLGTFFNVLGRVPNAELRGCSDVLTIE